MDGILIINKPKGFTSHDVVAKLRGILRTKKIGHTGTLDPDATGVLPVCVGKATRLCEVLADHDKCYRARIRLGISTDTEDLSGTVLSEISSEEVKRRVAEEDFRKAVEALTGDLMQIPPMYSAIKIGGKKLYEYARAGVEIEREARPVTVYSVEILEWNCPEAELLISCSKGTYIRSFCRDLGDSLGVGGALAALERTKVDRFSLEDALTLEEVEACRDNGFTFDHGFVPLEEVFRDLPKVCTTPEEGDKRLRNGNKLLQEHFSPVLTKEEVTGYISVCDSDGTFLGLYRMDPETGELSPFKMFL
ncbi:MAG: tRNA pseudouridine(55) synthase TruB [Lachnospiraceae bacterium]|nr:tRNA pseudouridine(55) synthase TruB [Lachnospiraceae bacterium]